MTRATQANIVRSSARTANGDSGDQLVIGCATARFLLAVTSVAGTSPTLDIVIEGKTKSGNYVAIGKFAQSTKEDSQSIEITRLPPTYRIRWSTGGTNPSFTFELDAFLITDP